MGLERPNAAASWSNSGMPELQCLGLYLSRFELAELPADVSGIVEAAWMSARTELGHQNRDSE